MKRTTFFISFVLAVTPCLAQNIDSLLAEPEVIELSISTPQPRLKETFQISLDINHLKANIFKSLAGKIELSNEINSGDNDQLTINVNAIKKGKTQIGPLEFYLDKTKYTTNKVVYEVIDPLPVTNKGLWFRKVKTSDSTFCIIIEQRIPANNITTKKSDNSITFSTEPEYNEVAKFKSSYSIDGLRGSNSHTRTSFSSIRIDGVDKEFMYGYAVYYFEIVDKNKKIKITKDKFENIPDDYEFNDIIIR